MLIKNTSRSHRLSDAPAEWTIACNPTMKPLHKMKRIQFRFLQQPSLPLCRSPFSEEYPGICHGACFCTKKTDPWTSPGKLDSGCLLRAATADFVLWCDQGWENHQVTHLVLCCGPRGGYDLQNKGFEALVSDQTQVKVLNTVLYNIGWSHGSPNLCLSIKRNLEMLCFGAENASSLISC